MDLPEIIRCMVAGRAGTINDTGMSGSRVICYDDAVLKIGEKTEDTENACAMMEFLSGKLPVPRILAEETLAGIHYLLMSRVPGEMSCEERYMTQPRLLAKCLARALKLLWTVDITDCPQDQSLDQKLRQARHRVAEGLVDVDNVEPETFGEKDFRDPAHLLRWLQENRPEEDLVLSHGDFCLPNVFLNGEEVAGFIDLGRCGVADRYQDIALCYRSLCHNFDGHYGPAYPGFDPGVLFEELGIQPDWEKIRYFILLDELF